MRATPWQDIVKKTAEQLNLPEKLVKDLILTHWRAIRKEMGELKKIKVRVMGLGEFRLMPWRVDREIEIVKKRIKKITKGRKIESLKKYLVVVEYRKELKRLRGIRQYLLKEMKRHQQIRVKQEKMRKAYYPIYLKKLEEQKQDELNKTLESKGADSGGNHELCISEGTCGGDRGGATGNLRGVSRY